MSILVVGASGATGRLVVEQLLQRGCEVRAMVRSPERLPTSWQGRAGLTVIPAAVLDVSDQDLAGHVDGCSAVASCLGHPLSWKGLFGPPRRLVTDAVRRLCDAIRANEPPTPVRVVLMCSAGVRNRDLPEPVSTAERAVLGLLRLLVPPHADNEAAAEFLRSGVGPDDPYIEWAAVRPDSLTDADAVTPYEVHPSPVRSAIFNPGSTSRIQVGHFMAELATNDAVWKSWRGAMPVIYNQPV